MARTSSATVRTSAAVRSAAATAAHSPTTTSTAARADRLRSRGDGRALGNSDYFDYHVLGHGNHLPLHAGSLLPSPSWSGRH